MFAVALLLSLLARRPAPTAVAFLVAGTVLVRWGSSSLAALAGAQAVFGPAAGVGTGPEAASAGLAAAALLVAAPGALEVTAPAGAPGSTARAPVGARPPTGLAVAAAAVPFGVVAAAVAAGPAYAGNPVLRLAATATGIAAAYALVRWAPHRLLPLPAVAAAGAALALGAGG